MDKGKLMTGLLPAGTLLGDMFKPHFGEAIVGGPKVRSYRSFWRNLALNNWQNAFRISMMNRLKVNEASYILFHLFNRNKYHGFGLGRAALCLRSCGLAADIGFVHNNGAVKKILNVTLPHRIPELVQHVPGSLVAAANVFTQAYRGDSLLVGRNEVNGQEPLRQRKFGLVKYRTSSNAGLRAAISALKHPSAPQLVARLAPTLWANKPLWPSMRNNGFKARFFGGILGHEFLKVEHLVAHFVWTFALFDMTQYRKRPHLGYSKGGTAIPTLLRRRGHEQNTSGSCACTGFFRGFHQTDPGAVCQHLCGVGPLPLATLRDLDLSTGRSEAGTCA